MNPSTISPCIIVQNVQLARDFYSAHLNAVITFDCGWYVNMEIGTAGATLQFMQPQSPEQPLFQGGLTYNMQLQSTDLVNTMHDRIVGAGLPVVMPLEDHPWGDRGFATLDPYGVALYIYAETEPSAEFQQYFKK
ncbi:VOC family protein [uncultured Pseudodesulfovibrio sp.]|uniref:VOC family protein n=1 Tax=uncultured Pseudodesulfovibrio sp. TaxID=2035858 RepID=UPI0029C69D2F|nr:VOC family protein [uncultured Pseudodesulfovibrio sp.]